MSIFGAFRSSGSRTGIFARTVDDFISMLENCHWMYQRAATDLWVVSDQEATRQAIYERDILVNRTERAIRKKIVEHLAIQPKVETTYCLVLMSVVKDAERIGDYCKNIMDVAAYHPTAQDRNELVAEFQGLQAQVEAMFLKVGKAFRESDEALGAELIQQERETTKACERLIGRILDHDEMSGRQAVTYALLARFDKRIAAHLGNIASSLVMPVHKLDYFDEQYLPGHEPPP